MVALTKDRNTPEAIGQVDEHPVLAATEIFAGSIVVLDAAGWAKPAVTATGLVVAGRAEEQVDNSAGANGALRVRVKRGVFRYGNSAAGDLIAQADIGADCYLVDDQTVAKTDGTGTRSLAGKVVQVDAIGVWVKLGII
ncbi:MAG: hypothetical protein GEU91_14145 [Rhizobiales bacterium]|nr:hypothetical protein [Hyphomicrobiales bacterium]